jgi:hypothetical protein
MGSAECEDFYKMSTEMSAKCVERRKLGQEIAVALDVSSININPVLYEENTLFAV